MRKTAIALALALLPGIAAAQVYLPPGVGLPPQSVIGNTLPQTGDAVAVSFAQLRSSLSIAAVKTCASHQWFNTLATGGVLGCSQPALSDIAGFGTGSAAALAINVGSAGSFVVNGGALGTPASGTMTNVTGLPIATGVSGIGTGVASALATNVGSAGALITNGGILGTPSSGTATNITGLPVATGVSGLGTGIATALAVNVGSAGAPVVNGGVLGTPSSGVGTNLTALNGTQLTSGTIPAARTNGHQNGTATNDNAAAGEIGEYIEGTLVNGSATSLVNNTAKTVISISLTAGDWDVSGTGYIVPAATTTFTSVITSISLTNNTLDQTAGRWLTILLPTTTGAGNSANYGSIAPVRISVSGTTTVYLVAQVTFAVSTCTAWGNIRARRMR